MNGSRLSLIFNRQPFVLPVDMHQTILAKPVHTKNQIIVGERYNLEVWLKLNIMYIPNCIGEVTGTADNISTGNSNWQGMIQRSDTPWSLNVEHAAFGELASWDNSIMNCSVESSISPSDSGSSIFKRSHTSWIACSWTVWAHLWTFSHFSAQYWHRPRPCR